MTDETTSTEDEGVPYERLVGDLETLVEKLEGGKLTLEESLTAYEKGVHLVRRAQRRLDEMDRRLEMLTADGRVVQLDDQEKQEKEPG